MEQERIIQYLRDFFNGLDAIRQPERYSEKSGDFAKYYVAEKELRSLVLTEKDRKVLSRLDNYNNFRDYWSASELIPECETTSAVMRIHDFVTHMYHLEEARNGDI